MKMQKEFSSSLLYYPILLFLFLSTLNSCVRQNENTSTSSNSVVKITHGSLNFEVNENLKTKFYTTQDDIKSIMNDFQSSETIGVNEESIIEFKFLNIDELELKGVLSGRQWVVNGIHTDEKVSIEKKMIITAYDVYSDLLTTKVIYKNVSDEDVYITKWTNNQYSILSQEDSPLFWAFQGSSSQSRSDWIRPLEPGYYQKNFMGMNATDYGGGVPVTSIWRSDVNIATGHLALVPKEVNLPTEIPKKGKDVIIGVSKDFKERTVFKSKSQIETLETFISITKGDYFENLSRYSKLMQDKGIHIVEPEPAAFEPIWCAWGYERKFTLDEIVGTLPKVKELGIKWAVLDDGFQIAEGDWDANPKKFPNGNKEIKKLVDDIHDHGLKAKIWWTPLAADPHSDALKKDPDMRIFKEDESPQFITWWDAYCLSPANPKTERHTKEIIDLFMNQWGFDGLKMDGQHMNGVGADFGIDDPQKSVEELPAFFQMIYDETRKIKPNAVIENCPCGACMSYFNMASMNQAVSSDPLSSWQVRHKGKTYKALVPNTAYYGDHVELSDNANDFASSFGIGAVLGTKFTWPKDNPYAEASYLLTPEKEKIWKKWFSLYNDMMLSKEAYMGDLYDIGYDKPETHVIKKGEVMYYAFYAKSWNGNINLKGLEADRSYTINDYFNNKKMGTISPDNHTLEANFSDFLLLEVIPMN
ncbi:glycoside hydrolase family 36 protein [Aquimarina pacifica]|uniref:glycoside hydrolase family 36 protein n=1 Tax=Aquimarina pacifica TaxID=1296415 RepID=UPI00046FD1AC|nr:glycoside hydrolase family 36 protein [Aquimarina pacifica]